MTAPDNLFDISRKRILVTGAARGNGEAIATGLLRAELMFRLRMSIRW